MLEEQILKDSDDLINDNYGSLVICSKIGGEIDEDLFSENLAKMYEVYDKYKSDMSKFNTYLTSCLFNNRVNYIRDNIIEEEVTVKKEQLERVEDKRDIQQSYQDNLLLDEVTKYIYELPERERVILENVLFNDMTYTDVGEKFGISRQRVYQIYRRRLDMLQAKFSRWRG